MPKYIKPLDPPRIAQPSDNAGGEGEFRLDGAELYLYDLYAEESVKASGTYCELFIRDYENSKVDALYAEPSETAWEGPFAITIHVEWPEFTPEATEDGLRALAPSGAWIPRKTIEDCGSRPPREGDIIRFWKLPYFDNKAGRYQPAAKVGFYFDIIQVNDDGHVHDDASFVGFRCDLKRRTNSPPEINFNKAKGENEPC